MDRPVEEDRWYFLKLRSDRSGAKDFQVPFASGATLAEDLESCVALGLLPRAHFASHQADVIEREDFSYIPSLKSRDIRGRRVRLALPEYSSLSGDLALRVEVSREGEVLGKELLFSTDEKLGQLVLQDLEHGLTIAAPGDGPGPFVDILRLKIEHGVMVVFGQTHHSIQVSK